MRPSLQFSEWTLVGTFVLLLAALVFVSVLHPHRRAAKKFGVEQALKKNSVYIQGEVQKPGAYKFFEGTRVIDAVKKSHPTRYANLEEIDLQQRIIEGQTIVIPKLKALSIRIEGEVVAPVVLELPLGSRLIDLKSKVQCTPNADFSFFKRRRLLKHQEIVTIPKKNMIQQTDE